MSVKPSRQDSARFPRALTRKGRQTRQTLVEAARDAFADQGYYNASVSEIGRRAGVSQGAFYQYFQNKDQVLFEINDRIIEAFWDRARALELDSLEFQERMARVVRLILDHAREFSFYERTLGEFELIDLVTIGYYASISRFFRVYFRKEADLGQIKSIDPNLLAYGLIGLADFNTADWGPDSPTYDSEQLVEMTVALLRRGIGGPAPRSDPDPDAAPGPPQDKAYNGPDQEKEFSLGQVTKRAIFQAAEEVFGQYGFHRAGISEITRRAGVAQGTFYVHFKSKMDLMAGFVQYLSREMRWELKKAAAKAADRREVELEGLSAFFQFLASHRRIYRVVSESETIGADVGRWYYRKLAEGYVTGLQDGIDRGEIIGLPAHFLARSLMGFYHMVGLKWLVWNSSLQAEMPQYLVDDAAHMVIHGLDPD